MTDEELEQTLLQKPALRELMQSAMADIERGAHSFAFALFQRKIMRYVRRHLGDPDMLITDLPIPPQEEERMGHEAECFEHWLVAPERRKSLRRAHEIMRAPWGHA